MDNFRGSKPFSWFPPEFAERKYNLMAQEVEPTLGEVQTVIGFFNKSREDDRPLKVANYPSWLGIY